MNLPALTCARSLGIADLSAAYRDRRTTPAGLVRELYARIATCPDPAVWISLLPIEQVLEQAQVLADCDPASLPLYGVPFAIKDNIDLADVRTTAACEAFAYLPEQSAQVVTRLIQAGAMPIGKTNLDQLATGLVGTRSPYGICHSSFNANYISGGSSSGSAVAVAHGLVSFALGTDTAGSGRVPAAFNNLIGWKPTCGRLSPAGLVPACRTADTISVLALTAEDAARVGRVAEGFDPAQPYSRRAHPCPGAAALTRALFRFGVPRAEQLQFFGNDEYPRLFDAAVAHMERLGAQRVLIDFTPFLEAGQLLYGGPWVAERYLVAESILRRSPQSLLPVTRQIIERGSEPSAADAFRAQYQLQGFKRAAELAFDSIDVLLTPTVPTHYRIDEIEADPIRLNSRLGYYTTFMNLLDMAAVAVPAGFTTTGLPFGVTLAAPAWSDMALLSLASRLHRASPSKLGATQIELAAEQHFDWSDLSSAIPVAVCGAHMEGLPLNHQLMQRGAVLLERTRTAASYRLYTLPGGPPYRPGLIAVDSHGAAIEVEVWSVPAHAFGSFVAGIPSPLGIGKITLGDRRQVSGFLCEAHALSSAQDITSFGGWRAFIASRSP
ncbi:MAG TPA: allophanate hydrolase [Steroidobacteraceae bacterium]|jgi:allophanate hydrolase|nr:allophanate hydrolase [Steroidobacteraceae bacterium]